MQTELHHVRTLKIMGALFRRAMLEELQLDPGTVQRIFPCLDELSHIHERFLAQLLERRRESLAQDSNKNFVIDRLGDILVTQVGTGHREMGGTGGMGILMGLGFRKWVPRKPGCFGVGDGEGGGTH